MPVEPAQKKVVVESKVKGPKRLGQGVRGVGLGKKKHHQTIDSDDVDEQSDVLSDATSVGVICCTLVEHHCIALV